MSPPKHLRGRSDEQGTTHRNPTSALASAEPAETTGDGQTRLESQVALAQLERIEQDIRAKTEQFERRESALRERFDGVID
jgi:hypothetical protein